MMSKEAIETMKVLDLIADDLSAPGRWRFKSAIARGRAPGGIGVKQVGGGFTLSQPQGSNEILSGFELLEQLGQYPSIAAKLARPMKRGKVTVFCDD